MYIHQTTEPHFPPLYDYTIYAVICKTSIFCYYSYFDSFLLLVFSFCLLSIISLFLLFPSACFLFSFYFYSLIFILILLGNNYSSYFYNEIEKCWYSFQNNNEIIRNSHNSIP